MKKANFFVIGAPKCGITTLVRWLKEHPNAYISLIKESRYFDRDLGTRLRMDEKAYRALFKEAQEHHYAEGEATVWYLYS
jgi:N-acetyl-gamma-glutamylphosphate reductase